MAKLVEVVKTKGERPLVLMTNLQGQPCYMRPEFAEKFVKKGFVYGYDPMKNPVPAAKEKAKALDKTKKQDAKNYRKNRNVAAQKQFEGYKPPKR